MKRPRRNRVVRTERAVVTSHFRKPSRVPFPVFHCTAPRFKMPNRKQRKRGEWSLSSYHMPITRIIEDNSLDMVHFELSHLSGTPLFPVPVCFNPR